MAKEIERKFIVDTSLWETGGVEKKIKQAYLTIHPERVIRVRTANEKAFLTIKGKVSGISRSEFEYEIPFDDAMELFELCESKSVEKTRWVQEVNGKIWEIDVFEGDNEGLVVAEIELESEQEEFQKPVWALNEVSTDERYYNFYLSNHPFKTWS